MSDEQWYYSLKDSRVVQAHEVRAADRLGPYPDQESAARALELARERTESSDRADREWAERGAETHDD